MEKNRNFFPVGAKTNEAVSKSENFFGRPNKGHFLFIYNWKIKVVNKIMRGGWKQKARVGEKLIVKKLGVEMARDESDGVSLRKPNVDKVADTLFFFDGQDKGRHRRWKIVNKGVEKFFGTSRSAENKRQR